jgi:hypothetical protein
MEKLSRTSRSSEVRKTDAWPPSSRELLVQSGALGLTASLAPAVTSAAILSADRWPLCSSMIAADGKRFHVLVQGSVAQPDEAVAGDGFRAVAPDMRGIGDSYARLASRHEHEDLARLLRENTPRSDDQKALWEHDPIGLQRADLRGSR